MALCVYAKQPMQGQIEAMHNLPILYNIYGYCTLVNNFSRAKKNIVLVESEWEPEFYTPSSFDPHFANSMI
jgi:hypothetical protein